MVSNLAQVPPPARRRLALLLTPTASLLLCAGLLAAVFGGGIGWIVIGIGVLVISVLLGGIAIGLQQSANRDEVRAAAAAAEAELDAVLMAAAPCGGECGSGACGVDDCAVKSLPRS